MPGNPKDFSINNNETNGELRQDDNYMDRMLGKPGVPPNNGGNDNSGNGRDIFKRVDDRGGGGDENSPRMMLPYLNRGLKMTVSFLKVELNKPVPKFFSNDDPDLLGRDITCKVI